MFHFVSNKNKSFQLNHYAVDNLIDVTAQKEVSTVYAESIQKVLFDRDRCVASALL